MLLSLLLGKAGMGPTRNPDGDSVGLQNGAIAGEQEGGCSPNPLDLCCHSLYYVGIVWPHYPLPAGTSLRLVLLWPQDLAHMKT